MVESKDKVVAIVVGSALEGLDIPLSIETYEKLETTMRAPHRSEWRAKQG